MNDEISTVNDLKIKDDEYIKENDVLTSKQIEKHVEKSVPSFFQTLGIDVWKIKETNERTPDYSSNDLDIEVTAMHQYLPHNSDMDAIIKKHKENNLLICAYLYLENEKPRIKNILSKQLEEDLSILCLRQHISLYKNKIFKKIDNKYNQSSGKDQIIIMDFRLAPFDPLSLKKGIKEVLTEKCLEFSFFLGIIANIPKEIGSDILDEPYRFFVKNPYFKGNSKLEKLEKNYSNVNTNIWMTPQQIYVKVKPGKSYTIPCMECPDRDEIDKIGLPTI